MLFHARHYLLKVKQGFIENWCSFYQNGCLPFSEFGHILKAHVPCSSAGLVSNIKNHEAKFVLRNNQYTSSLHLVKKKV